MIVRHLTEGDVEVLETFDLGSSGEVWLDEVREIVAGLVRWRDDPECEQLERRALVGVEDGEIVAVAADQCLQDGDGRVTTHRRYLMVVAVRGNRQRTGAARLMTESVFAAMRAEGVQTVRWLVHPANHASLGFSRSVFPDADETSPPDDQPYVAFTLHL